MHVYVLCDLEGVSGVVDFDTDTAPGQPNYPRSLRLATAELNAVIRGLRRGGATEVFVLDGHGAGGLDIELVTEPAEVLLGRPIAAPFGLDRKDIDSVALFAHHSRANTPEGNLCHSWSHTTVVECRLNDQPIGEIGWYCHLAGYFGKPVILITGDDKACDEARSYVPEILTACVKVGVNTTTAICRSPAVARAIIEKAAEKAVRTANSIGSVCPKGPFTATWRFSNPTLAETYCRRHAMARRVEETTVAIESNDFLELTISFLG